MDNYFKTCPPRMEDGRHITDYRTATRREEYNRSANNLKHHNDHRIFMQQNAIAIMNNEWNHLKQTSSCRTKECVHTYPTRVYSPMFVEERQRHDKSQKTQTNTCEMKNDYRLI